MQTGRIHAFALAWLVCFAASGSAAQNSSANWVTSWSASQQGMARAPVNDATLRLIARVTLPGDQIRIRLDNSFGNQPVTFSHVTVAPRVRGAAIAGELLRPITFSGKPSVTVPPGDSMESDPAALRVEAQQDLAVSIYVGGSAAPSQHNNAQETSYATDNGGGDQTMSVDGKTLSKTIVSMPWLKSV